MNATRLLRASLAAVLLAGGAGAASQQPATFRSGVDLVRLDALVTQGGKPVGGLSADDFEVMDNGVRQQLRVATTAGSVSVALVLDTSGSLEGPQLDQLIRASQTVVGLLRPEDEVSLATFSRRLALPAGPGRDPAVIRAALASAKASGSTAMWDAVFGGLALAAGSGGRSLVLLFTDGLENSSWLTEADLAESARRSESVIYVVRPPGPAAPSSSPAAARVRLRGIADRTGGSVLDTDTFGNLSQRFGAVLEEFRARYLLSYEPTGVRRDDGWHTVEVRVKGGRATVKARPGYYARPPTS
jgi:Ca-activated chloride channel homolog